MPAFDFTEIPSPVSVGKDRDQFELFAREFFEALGFNILVRPDRGPDAGRDLVVEESRMGAIGSTKIRWLVSCKHHAHSGNAVSPDAESDIHDRVKTHGCQGFAGFYSTVPSSGLAAKLNSTGVGFEVQVFDPEKIEKHLLKSPDGQLLAKRFFPKSWAIWRSQQRSGPAKIFKEAPELLCAHCNTNLLEGKPRGIIVMWCTSTAAKPASTPRTERIYWCCKGGCDKALEKKYDSLGLIDRWEEIDDLTIPAEYLRWVMAILNHFNRKEEYSPEAFAALKKFLINLFPLVCRDQTDEERERLSDLSMLPDWA